MSTNLVRMYLTARSRLTRSMSEPDRGSNELLAMVLIAAFVVTIVAVVVARYTSAIQAALGKMGG